MTSKKDLSPEAQEIVAGQNEALERLPEDRAERVGLIDKERVLRKKKNDDIAQAKKQSGHESYVERLSSHHGYTPQALKIMDILDPMPARARAATIRQVLLYVEDTNKILPDLFDNTLGSIKPGDEDAAVFDSTGTGKAQGGEQAQPRTTEEMAASHEPKGTGPGLTHDEIVAAFEAQNKAYLEKGGKGKKPNAWHEAKKALDESNAARDKAEAEAEVAPEPTKPDNVVNFSKQQREQNKAGEDHIRQQSEKKASERAGKATTAREEKKPSGRSKKAEAAAPEANPALADDEDEEAPAAAPPPGQIGGTAPSFRIG